MPRSGNKSKKARLTGYLAERKLLRITEQNWHELLGVLGPISESYLRHLLAESGVPVEAPFGGVRQKNFDELEQSLLEMEAAYQNAQSAGERQRATQCRNAVIQAKDHARLAARNPKTATDRKAMKEEMVEWMLVWLENPGVFPAWVKIRKTKMPPLA